MNSPTENGLPNSNSQKKFKSRRQGNIFSNFFQSKLKYVFGGLFLVLLVAGLGAGYYLSQQEGAGDVRQQASGGSGDCNSRCIDTNQCAPGLECSGEDLELMPWTDGGPSSAWRSDYSGLINICNGDVCWRYDDNNREWHSLDPVVLSDSPFWENLNAGPDGEMPWTDGGPSSAWRSDYSGLINICNGDVCWRYDDNNREWHSLDPVVLSDSSFWENLNAGPDGEMPWTDGGPSSAWRSDYSGLINICNGDVCWRYDDNNREWHSLDPVVLSDSPFWENLNAGPDGEMPWTDGGPSSAWRSDYSGLINICNGDVCWRYDDNNREWHSLDPVVLSDSPFWENLNAGPGGFCRNPDCFGDITCQCTITDACDANTECDDSNPCTTDVCNDPGASNSTCSNTAVEEGTSCGNHVTCNASGNCNQCENNWADCDDNMSNGCEVNVQTDEDHCGACNSSCASNEICQNGSCVQEDECTTKNDCTASNECKIASCDTSSHPYQCTETNKANGTSCSDGDGRCVSGVCRDWEDECINANDCTTSNECKVASCDTDSHPYQCIEENKSDGTSCSDGVCQGGSCVAEDDTTLTLKVSLAGVPHQEGDNYFHPVKSGREFSGTVTLISAGGNNQAYNIPFTYDISDKYYTSQTINLGNISGGPYAVSVKGPRHRSIRFCYQGDQASRICSLSDFLAQANALTNQSDASDINFIWLAENTNNVLDLSAQPLQAGDLPIAGDNNNTQNGVVDVFDYSFLFNCLRNREEGLCVSRADLNYSGFVDNIDLGLLRETLSKAVDEL